MQLFAYQAKDGEVRIGVTSGDRVSPLTTLADFYRDPHSWCRGSPDAETLPLETLDPAPPIPLDAKILCAAINYGSHGAETGFDKPERPNLFARWTACLSTDGATVPVPASEHRGLDWEVELAAIVGETLVDATAEQAAGAVFGYAVFNDISGRVNQGSANKLAKGQWALGKNLDNSAAVSPQLVTADAVDAGNLRLGTRLNGELMQDGNTGDMLFSVGELLAHASRAITLRPGDMVATGTPAGVGVARDPMVFMHAGDTVEAFIDGIGSVTSHIGAGDRG